MDDLLHIAQTFYTTIQFEDSCCSNESDVACCPPSALLWLCYKRLHPQAAVLRDWGKNKKQRRSPSNMNRSKPTSEAAPAYDELFDVESSATSPRTYTAVPQNDAFGENEVNNQSNDIESHAHNSSSLSQIDSFKPHVHCEVCDRQLERREKKKSEQECCQLVAIVFSVAFLCLMILGIVVAKATTRH